MNIYIYHDMVSTTLLVSVSKKKKKTLLETAGIDRSIVVNGK